MLSRADTAIRQSLDEGHLVFQGPGLYAAFISSVPRQEAMFMDLPETQSYTYGVLQAEGYRLEWTGGAAGSQDPGRLFSNYRRQKIQAQLRQRILMLSVEAVDPFLDRVGEPPHAQGAHPAERLYKAVRGRTLGGIVLEACGTYDRYALEQELVIVDASGGYGIGLNSRAGIATDADLFGATEVALPTRL